MKAALALLGLVLVAVAIGAYLLAARAGSPSADTRELSLAHATAAALNTVVARQNTEALARETEIAQLRQQVERLQRIGTAVPTTVTQGNGPHGYLASFQAGKYTYILYLEWVESSGFVHNGRLLTVDNYGKKVQKSFVFTGVNNNETYGFTMSNQGVTSTFTGKANSDRTFTVIGLPWNVFSGFIGGTFTQTLHAATLPDYRTAVTNLVSSP